MKTSAKTLEFTFERTISAPPEELWDAWLNPKIPGTVWNAAEQFVLNPTVGGLFFWHIRGTSHYGRFTEVARPGRIQHTWVSPYTLGQESVVTVTFQKQGAQTLMTLVHSNLPDHELAKAHKDGWTEFLGIFVGQFGAGSRKEYRRDEAHPPKK